MWLANLASGVNLSVFYDWRDDGDDPKENEHRFGTVRRDFTPKPSFLAARALIDALSGFTFRHRLKGRTEDDWRLLFQRAESDELAVVTWSADPKAAEAAQTPVVRAVKPGDADWQALRRLASLRVAPGPLVEAAGASRQATARIDVVNRGEAAAVVEASVTDAAGGVGLRLGPTTVQPRVPAILSSLIPVGDLRSGQRLLSLRLLWDGAELPAVASIPLLRVDPLNVAVAPAGREIRVFVDNPAKGAFAGAVRLVADGKTVAENALRIQKGEAKAEVLLPQPATGGLFEVRVVDDAGKVAARMPARRYVALGNFAQQTGATSAYEAV
ncbi:MAG TPA: hypothetical protein VM490_17720, partial [Armatimonadaceae bacterium]|nr:hypothetical protein [Armatimonadaceae bacterium]